MKKLLIFLLALIVMLLNSISCQRDVTTNTDLSMEDEFQSVLDEALNVYNIKGISAVVLIPGKKMWKGVSGISHESKAITPEMLFRIGSITKNYIAALVLKYVDQKWLNLIDPINKWLPDFPHIDMNITIKQLLNHTSGLYDFNEHPDLWEEVQADLHRKWSPEELMVNFMSDPYFLPGKGWKYSNTNYILLGMIIKQISGSMVSEELRQQCLLPLGLGNTFLEGEESIGKEMAHGWYDIDKDGLLDDFSTVPRAAINSATWTSGAVVATAEDVAIWASYLFDGEVLKPNSFNEMTNFFPLTSQETTGYGLGTYRFTFFGKTLWGHTGGTIDFSSVILYLPEDRATFVVLFNQVEPMITNVASQLLDIYLKGNQ
jgi:D-alanyl-D-alanine carboxypeptidase